MSGVALFGLPSCDTVRKARKWLEAEGLAHEFTAFAKMTDLAERLPDWAERTGMERLLNTKSRNFKALSAEEQAAILADPQTAFRAMAARPQLIKRPVLVTDDAVLTGFNEGEWRGLLGR